MEVVDRGELKVWHVSATPDEVGQEIAATVRVRGKEIKRIQPTGRDNTLVSIGETDPDAAAVHQVLVTKFGEGNVRDANEMKLEQIPMTGGRTAWYYA